MAFDDRPTGSGQYNTLTQLVVQMYGRLIDGYVPWKDVMD